VLPTPWPGGKIAAVTLYEELERLIVLLNAAEVPYALCGGLAISDT
jgi:hypothetical protein